MDVHECIDPLDRPVWGAEESARSQTAICDRSTIFWITGKIDAAKVGRVWTSTPRRILRSLGMEG